MPTIYAVWDNETQKFVKIGKVKFHETSAPAMKKVNDLNGDGPLRYSLASIETSVKSFRQKSLPRE